MPMCHNRNEIIFIVAVPQFSPSFNLESTCYVYEKYYSVRNYWYPQLADRFKNEVLPFVTICGIHFQSARKL